MSPRLFDSPRVVFGEDTQGVWHQALTNWMNEMNTRCGYRMRARQFAVEGHEAINQDRLCMQCRRPATQH
jgi:hypothetical protein